MKPYIRELNTFLIGSKSWWITRIGTRNWKQPMSFLQQGKGDLVPGFDHHFPNDLPLLQRK